jgi:PAS domain S-box-containing protein
LSGAERHDAGSPPPQHDDGDARDPDRQLRNVVDALPAMTFVLDAEGVLASANAAALTAAVLSPTDVIGRRLSQSYWWSWSPEAQARLEDAIAKAKEAGAEDYREEIRVGADRRLTVMLHIAPLRLEPGKVGGFVVSAVDISELVMMQERQTLLAAELTHRVKNILTIVKALVSRAARRAETKEALAQSLEGRIAAMAASISQLSRSQWTGYDLREVIYEQLENYERDRIALHGPAVQLSPKAAMAFALITYELASNAVKYGALRGADGYVVLEWGVDDQLLRVTWREVCASPTTAANETGFGSTLIRNLAEGDLGAALDMTYAPEGLRVLLEVPVTHIRQAAAEYADMEIDECKPRDVLQDKRVLIVEDSPMIALDLAGMLEAAGAKVLGPCATIDEAAAVLERADVDIAFLDASAECPASLTLAKAARKRGVSMLFATMAEDVASLREAFPDAIVLPKPFSETDALQALRTLA